MNKFTALILLFLCGLCSAQDSKFLIVPGERVGPVTATTTRNGITRLFGAQYVKSGKVMMGEGESAPATIVYPDHPDHRFKIIWKPGPSGLATPKSIWFQGDESVWRTREGIGLGTSLARAEKVNRGHFRLLGFGWDYEGNVVRWNGALTEKLKNTSVRFTLSQKAWEFHKHEELTPIVGDVEISSDNAVFHLVDPHVHEMVLSF